MNTARTAFVAITLFASSSFAFAGPGPQYWANLGKKADQKEQVPAQASKDAKTERTDSAKANEAAAGCTSCSGCQKKV